MEETRDDQPDAKSEQSIDENFSWEDWTVIDDGNNTRNQDPSCSPKSEERASSETSFSDIDNASDAEEACECKGDLSERDSAESPAEKSGEKHCSEESDGVSVITESDTEELVASPDVGEIVLHENAESLELSTKRNWDTKIDNLRMIFLIVCCLLGVAILSIAIDGRTPPNDPEALDSTMITKCYNLIESGKRLAYVKKTSAIGAENSARTKPQNRTGNEAEQLSSVNEYLKTIDSSTDIPDNELLERLQIFSRTMCLLEDIRYPESKSEARQSDCDKHSILTKLENMRILLKDVVSSIHATERPTYERFLQNVDKKIKTTSDSLVADLTRTLSKLSAKNDKKIEKIGVKIAERLCILRNTLPRDNKHHESLGMINDFIGNCDEIASKNSDERVKNGPPERPISPKHERKNSQNEAPHSLNSYKNLRRHELKRQNNTGSIEDSLGNQENPWETRKCAIKRSSSVLDASESDETCATLLAPPKTNWNLKQKSLSMQKHPEEIAWKKSTKKQSYKPAMKDDRGASKVSKQKPAKEFRKQKNYKQMTLSSNDEDAYRMKKMKKKPTEKERSTTFLSGPEKPNENSKYTRMYTPDPAVRRGKRILEKQFHDFILLDRKDEKYTMPNGHWQFDRSRIRDQMRKEDSVDNWYFDRVGNRQNSRMHCKEPNEDPRCGNLQQ